MMSRLPKNLRKIYFLPKQSQDGVTLLLTILVLAAITAIAFSIATIVFAELKAAGDISRTEPALYASEGIIEEAIYKIKRGANVTYDISLNGVTLNNPAPTETQRDDKATIYRVLVNSTKYGGTTNVTQNIYYLINPDDPQNLNGGYNHILIKNRGSASIAVGICNISFEDCVDQNGDFHPNSGGVGPLAISAGSNTSVALDTTKAYILYVVYTGGAGSPDTFVEFDLATPTNPDIGLPYFNKKAVDVTATFTGLTRKYRAIIPIY